MIYNDLLKNRKDTYKIFHINNKSQSPKKEGVHNKKS
jgi:hypothetical protein